MISELKNAFGNEIIKTKNISINDELINGLFISIQMSNEKSKFISNYKKGLPQIISKKLIADIETPFSSLLKISKGEKYSFSFRICRRWK